MARKFLGMLCLAIFALSLIGCGSSSTNSEEDECTKDPNAIGCNVDDPEEDDVLTDGQEP